MIEYSRFPEDNSSSSFYSSWFRGVKEVKKKKIKIEIAKSCQDKINGWCKAANSEVSGMGLVRKEKGVYKVYDVFILKQTCGFAETTLDRKSSSWSNLMSQVVQKEGTLKNLRFWWHTHYNFNVFFSGTDTDTINELGAGASWFLALVTNQRGEQKWLDRKGQEDIGKFTDGNNFSLKVINDHQPVTNNFKADIRKNVKEHKSSWSEATSEAGDCWVFDKKRWVWEYKVPAVSSKYGPSRIPLSPMPIDTDLTPYTWWTRKESIDTEKVEQIAEPGVTDNLEDISRDNPGENETIW